MAHADAGAGAPGAIGAPRDIPQLGATVFSV